MIKIVLMATIYLGLSGPANALLIVEVSATDTTFSMTLNGQAEVGQTGALYKDRLLVGFGGGLADGLYSWITMPAELTLSHNLPGGITLTGSDGNPSWIQAYHSASVENVTFDNHIYSWTIADPSKAPDLSNFGLHLGWNCSGLCGGIPGTESFGPVISATVVPEPNTALLLGIGLVGLAARWR
jgi:hypothetical protein